MKIYFAGSIRGGRDDWALYRDIVEFLKGYGTVLTEHVGDVALTDKGEGANGLPDDEIYRRDADWLRECDVVVAEVSTPSLGVGYELGLAEAEGKRVLCLAKASIGGRLSPMISGNPGYACCRYGDLDEAKGEIEKFFKK